LMEKKHNNLLHSLKPLVRGDAEDGSCILVDHF
jgi:hypothetical protein